MCGLVGIAGDTNLGWKDVFTQLLLFDSVRGIHSTGAGFVDRYKEDFKLVKRPGDPFNLFREKEYKDAIGTTKSTRAILGHNRHATVGQHTEENAHPFAFKHLVGMHNGTLDKNSREALHEFEKFGTDSEAIFHTINELGLDETMQRMAGAWALIWYDKRKHTLNMLRNDKRPLHYCYSEDRCTIVWASELPMLKYVMERQGKKAADNKFYVLLPDMHYVWRIPESVMKKLDSPTMTEKKGQKWVYKESRPFGGTTNATVNGTTSTNVTSTTCGINNTYGNGKKSKYNNKKAFLFPIDFEHRPKSKGFRPPYSDQYGITIKKYEFEPMVGEGCACCDKKDQKWGSFVHVMGGFTGYHTPYLCEECYNTEETYNFAKYAI